MARATPPVVVKVGLEAHKVGSRVARLGGSRRVMHAPVKGARVMVALKDSS